MNPFIDKLRRYKEWIIVPVLLCVAGISHAYNMFRFPYYTNDEGTYMSQAWSVITQGKLAPYTYWYDHAPAGWFFIALWVKLTGGFFTFGYSINSGRVFMLILHIAIAAMLYYCAKKLSGSSVAGIIAVLIFSLSPLGIYFQRKILLDNIMVFWMFASFAILLKDKLKLTDIMLSGLLFGIAVLTKESAIVFFPAFLYLVYTTSHLSRKRFAVVKWLVTACAVISIYILYALLKSEFFPVGFLGNMTQHVSLLGSFIYQATRGNPLPFWNPNSDFYLLLVEALSRDRFSVIFGGISLLGACLLSIKVKSFRIPVLFSICYLIFLIRGGLTIDYYIIPLLPLLALCDGMIVAYLLKKISFRKEIIHSILVVLTMIVIGYAFSRLSTSQYTQDETTSQVEAVQWIKQNVDPNAYIAIDDYEYVDLHAARFPGDPIFPHAEWFWKIATDPQVEQYGATHNLDYISLGGEMLEQIRANNMPVIKTALDHSVPVATYTKGSSSYFDLKNYISTNGDWEIVYKVDSADQVQLQISWQYYLSHFITPDGNVVDASRGGITTSEGQSYAMLRAVMVDDQASFDNVWAWTRNHLEFRTNDKLFSWLWGKDPTTDTYRVTDPNTATDADEDIALSLVLASKEWNDPSYLAQAEPIISDIWNKEVVAIDGHYYLASSAASERPSGLLVDPSYLSPATYKIFGMVDPTHPWDSLSDDSYYFLNELANQQDNTTHLPPNLVLVTPQGNIESAAKYSDSSSDDYGYDAFRALWRVALDSVWFNDPQAQAYLEKVSPFFVSKINSGKLPGVVIDLKGNDISTPDELSTDSGMLAALFITNKPYADKLYSSIYTSSYNQAGYWGDPTNYYDQNWSWFTDALHTNELPMFFSSQASSWGSDLYVAPSVIPLPSPAPLPASGSSAQPSIASTTSGEAMTALPASQSQLQLPYAETNFSGDTTWQQYWGAMTVDPSHALDTEATASTTGSMVISNAPVNSDDYTFGTVLDWTKGQTFDLIAQYVDANDYLECNFGEPQIGTIDIRLEQYINGTAHVLAMGEINNYNQLGGSSISAYIRVQGTVGECSFNDITASTVFNDDAITPSDAKGDIGFVTWDPQPDNTQIIVKSISVKSN